MKLNCGTCNHSHEPDHVLFDDELLVANDAELDKIVAEIGDPEWFRTPVSHADDELPVLTSEAFRRYLLQFTDLLVVNTREHHANAGRPSDWIFRNQA